MTHKNRIGKENHAETRTDAKGGYSGYIKRGMWGLHDDTEAAKRDAKHDAKRILESEDAFKPKMK